MSADLIAKLERATGRDPELNRAIDEFDVRSRGKLAPDKPFCVEVSPDFTGSLDAKLPDEQIIEVKDLRSTIGWEKGSPEWVAYCLVPGKTVCVGHGHTEALARRIAALHARAA